MKVDQKDTAAEAIEQEAVVRENAASNPAKHTTVNKKKKSASGELVFWRITSSVLLLAVIVLAAMLFLLKTGTPIVPWEMEPETVSGYTAFCYAPVGEPQAVASDENGIVTLPQGPQIDGYTFLGWKDSDGNPVGDNTVTLYADSAYSAEYAVAFRNDGISSHHAPYLSINSEGCFRPNGKLSRASAVKLLYDSLDTELEGSAEFADVDPSAEYYKAAATLKDLGVITESRLHPDDPISRAELFEMLSHFFPKSNERYLFTAIPETDARYPAFCLAMDRGWISDLSVSPDADVSRVEVAHIFNLLRGRTPMANVDYAMVGTILDVSFDDPYFSDIVEAAIAHDAEITDAGEVWTSSEALPLLEAGRFFIGTAMHCIDDRGSAVVNGSYDNFDFGPDGVVTTGMPELDRLVQDVLIELDLDPSSMEGERMLRTIFNYVTYHNTYLRDGDHLHEVGETGWENDEAYKMLTTHTGNCYNYAAEFYVLARAIGYDAVIYSGTIDPTQRPHGWVEIEFDGEPYIFDTEIEFKEVTIGGRHSSYFKVPYWKAATWYYNRGEE
ncbi:MAG: S-layer homology domain-containing protein [Oscillospiraceae bacterium]|nr:S-layer homology domain-containing protein [Oscillospiraceae bacterium]